MNLLFPVLFYFKSLQPSNFEEPDPIRPCESDRFPDPWTLSLAQGEAVLLPILCQVLSKIRKIFDIVQTFGNKLEKIFLLWDCERPKFDSVK